jgi:3',5'-cyclic AMP phosphodiesterase CpdA
MPIYLPPISRRSFLKGALAAGAGAMLGREALADEPKNDPNRWVLISDIHVGSKREDSHDGTKPAETFALAARQVLALDPLPTAVIVTGDLAFLYGEADNYHLVRELFRGIRAAGIPMHLVLGNHDRRDHFWSAFPEAKPQGTLAGRQTSVIETPIANWFLMDSLVKTNFTPGEIGKPQLDWLANSLDARKDKPAILIAHHNLEWPGGLMDGTELLDLAAQHKQAKAYFYGHTHCWNVRKEKDIHIVNVPATAWLFDKTQPRGWLDIQLTENGATIVMNALDKKHRKHGERVELKWRA